jgi:sulfoxide reductase heme-binding subunit YedZ
MVLKRPSPISYLKANWLWLATHIGALIPLVLLIWDYSQNQLTVNPIQEATFRTGKTALILLVLSLAITPLNIVFGLKKLLPLRKPLGLYAFLYVSLHFLIFVWIDYGLNLKFLQEGLLEKRYALVGLAAFILLIPLALTSTQGWMKRLGKNWKRLHRLVYLVGILAVIHFVWLVKSDVREPLAYGAAVLFLLLIRWPALRRAISNTRYKVKQRRKTQTIVATE